MGSSYGENIKLTVFGQSHSAAIGMTLEGVPAGSRIDFEELYGFLQRRAPGRNEYSTARREKDRPEFLSGVVGNVTCGTPITAVIKNGDTRSGDYLQLKIIPRPGHADYTAEVKYGGNQDYRGGGHFSGRMTASLCIAGGICIQLLRREGIEIISRIAEIAGIADRGELEKSLVHKDFPTVDDSRGEDMRRAILAAKSEGDSVGGIVECKILGLPAGLGDPMFSRMEGRISSAVFGIPAVRGIEFGAGFKSAGMRGSENNDPFIIEDGKVVTETNSCGGLLGGITTGMPLVFRAAFKPTPSIAKTQRSVNLETMENTELNIHGRHDPCIVHRAVPCVEAAAAIAVYDAILQEKKK